MSRYGLSRYDPKRGRWKLGQVIKAYMQNADGPVTLEQLLHHLRALGYLVGSTRQIIDQFVDVDDDGRVHQKIGGSP